MKTKLLIALILLTSNTFWSCQDVVLIDRMEELEAVETEMIQEEMSLKSAEVIPLLLKHGEIAGRLIISNTSSTLSVRFIGSTNYDLEEVQLWIGTSPELVPTNKMNKPVPGKFTYRSSGKTEYLFIIPQQEIAPDYDFSTETTIYLFAHADAKNKQTDEEESAWSEGEYFTDELNQAVSFSTYIPTGGGGCFPHLAYCGQKFEGTFYFNINNGDQNMVADNDEIIGTARYIDEEIRFYFYQDWSFSGAEPQIVVTGFNEPGGQGYEIYSGASMAPSPPIYRYYGPLFQYNYYKVELKVQYCTTQ